MERKPWNGSHTPRVGEAASASAAPPEWTLGDRGFRRPFTRPRRESDEGEEEGFLYCLMYYFGEYLTGATQGRGSVHPHCNLICTQL